MNDSRHTVSYRNHWFTLRSNAARAVISSGNSSISASGFSTSANLRVERLKTRLAWLECIKRW